LYNFFCAAAPEFAQQTFDLRFDCDDLNAANVGNFLDLFSFDEQFYKRALGGCEL
jgi:hypothetical protein